MLCGRRYFMDTAMYAQQNRSEHGTTTTRVEVIYGKKLSAITLSNKRLRKTNNPHNYIGVI